MGRKLSTDQEYDAAIGAAVRQAREAVGLSQGDLAVQVDPESVYHWLSRLEMGANAVKADVVRRLEVALGLPLGAIVWRAGGVDLPGVLRLWADAERAQVTGGVDLGTLDAEGLTATKARLAAIDAVVSAMDEAQGLLHPPEPKRRRAKR